MSLKMLITFEHCANVLWCEIVLLAWQIHSLLQNFCNFVLSMGSQLLLTFELAWVCVISITVSRILEKKLEHLYDKKIFKLFHYDSIFLWKTFIPLAAWAKRDEKEDGRISLKRLTWKSQMQKQLLLPL